MSQFHSLAIKDIRKETDDCVSIAFDIPEALADKFRFEAGQNVTIRLLQNAEELRRTYSICSSPHDRELRIAVKKLEDGRFSTHAHARLKVGDALEVMVPSGRFTASAEEGLRRNFLAFAAGSGITPVISIIKTILDREPDSTFTLIYGNRFRSTIIFREQIEALKNRYMNRFSVHHILSREETDAPLNHGRIDAEKCAQIGKFLVDVHHMDHIFLCGPEEMIFTVRDWLEEQQVAREKIHFELFTVPGDIKSTGNSKAQIAGERVSHIKIKLDGITTSFDLAPGAGSILDAALRQGADLPYACRGGVCATCRARLVKGEVEMDNNYALESEELAAGFILTCQSHPRSDEVEIDFDEK